MNIQDFLSPNDVTIDVAPANKQKLLVELANKAGSRLRLLPNTILSELSKREELGSTGLGDGVAMPHARFKQIDKRSGCCFVFGSPSISTQLTESQLTLSFYCCSRRVLRVSS